MYNKTWYEANRAKAAASRKAWAKKNPEKVKEHCNRSRRKRQAYMMRLLARYKRWCGCKDCGEKDPVVLQFDHVRGKKTAGVSTLVLRSRKVLLAEIRKCEVRCANCHVRVTVARGQY